MQVEDFMPEPNGGKGGTLAVAEPGRLFGDEWKVIEDLKMLDSALRMGYFEPSSADQEKIVREVVHLAQNAEKENVRVMAARVLISVRMANLKAVDMILRTRLAIASRAGGLNGATFNGPTQINFTIVDAAKPENGNGNGHT